MPEREQRREGGERRRGQRRSGFRRGGPPDPAQRRAGQSGQRDGLPPVAQRAGRLDGDMRAGGEQPRRAEKRRCARPRAQAALRRSVTCVTSVVSARKQAAQLAR